MTGVLVAVVGPSGAGKDTLMDLARAAFTAEADVTFVQRVVTRPAEAGGEDHRPMDRDGFIALREAGGFALWWEAHGLLYGLPRGAVEGPLAEGHTVVANLSRGVLPDAASRYPLRVLEITAPPAIRAARLASRGRETAEEVERRLSREMPLPAGLDVETLTNDGTLAEGAARVVAALRAAGGRRAA